MPSRGAKKALVVLEPFAVTTSEQNAARLYENSRQNMTIAFTLALVLLVSMVGYANGRGELVGLALGYGAAVALMYATATWLLMWRPVRIVNELIKSDLAVVLCAGEAQELYTAVEKKIATKVPAHQQDTARQRVFLALLERVEAARKLHENGGSSFDPTSVFWYADRPFKYAMSNAMAYVNGLIPPQTER